MTEHAVSPLRILVIHPIFDFLSITGGWTRPVRCHQVRKRAEAMACLGDTDVLVTMVWQNDFLEKAPDLRLVQSITSGVEQFDIQALKSRGVPLCNARGANAVAVAEHALALIFSIARFLPEARDDQARKFWRPLTAGRRRRELASSHVVIVGYGAIGAHLAGLCRALGIRVTVVRRHVPESHRDGIDFAEVDRFASLAALVDYVVLACPLTEQNRGMLNARVLAGMQPHAAVINVARGGLVVEEDLVSALLSGQIAAAGLDTFADEPLPESSPLWSLPNVVVTPHQAGESELYEHRVADILRENLTRLDEGRDLLNRIV
ncbi:D-2-hydroxyacid dehydrogenase [Acetobacter sp. AN02]|uniref:D-2-hydroxyacid dehydrogenase n=1 Tax=Acetobacter sp. AN02 TaxID=2894186 RepID=UPI0024341DFF|nr:D-2-hydroxyacid dehydrogenase [Acetobacter sp. AN02]MDG6093818.1 D-2-hydroxyacid dehydrogenase [Acetobacter sp. AN02]